MAVGGCGGDEGRKTWTTRGVVVVYFKSTMRLSQRDSWPGNLLATGKNDLTWALGVVWWKDLISDDCVLDYWGEGVWTGASSMSCAVRRLGSTTVLYIWIDTFHSRKASTQVE